MNVATMLAILAWCQSCGHPHIPGLSANWWIYCCLHMADPEAARLGRTSIVDRVFGGLLRSDVTCCACGFTSTAYDPFLDISLDMRCASCCTNRF